ncbi:MAG TPA: hypothetical protein PKY12_08655 [Catalimonadaceae bacterium]|nr:hypothetical protein [Catalimonadaceae bacterium]
MRFYFLLFALGTLSGCKSCKDNPCPGKATTANFFMYDRSPFMTETWKKRMPEWKDLDTDTLMLNTLLLVAEESGADVSYQWEVGAGTYTTKEVTVMFTDSPRPNFVEVKLTVRKTPNRSCFPLDSGVATYSRKLYFKEDFKTSLIFGIYHGYIDGNQSDTCTYVISPSFDHSCGKFYYYNFPVKKEKIGGGAILTNLQYGDIEATQNCIPDPVYGGGDRYGIYDPIKNELKAWARYGKLDGSFAGERRFTGKKIKSF